VTPLVRLPPPRTGKAEGGVGVLVRPVAITPPLEPVGSGVVAHVGVDAGGRRYDWSLRRLDGDRVAHGRSATTRLALRLPNGPATADNLEFPPVTLGAIFADRSDALDKIHSYNKVHKGKWFEVRGPFTFRGHNGEIDAFTAPSLRDDLRHLVEDVGAVNVVVDLEAVTFLDSSALGALVGVLRRLRERNGQLRIVQPVTAAARIFELTGLDAVLDLYPDRAAAVSAASE